LIDWHISCVKVAYGMIIQEFARVFLLLMAYQLVNVLFHSHQASSTRIVESSNHRLRYDDYLLHGPAPKEQYHELVFAVKQKNLEVLEAVLYDVSTRSSPHYGQHKSFDEIGRLVENREATAAISTWLQENGVSISSRTTYGEYISCGATIDKWETLLSTTFSAYEQLHWTHNVDDSQQSFYGDNVKKVIYRTEAISLPDELIDHIHTIFYAVHLPPRQSPRRSFEAISITNPRDFGSKTMNLQASIPPNTVNPGILASLYGVSGDGNGLGSQAVYERDLQTFYESDITLFQKTFNLTLDSVDNYVGSKPNPNICSAVIDNCIESSLDLQYIMSTGKSIPTTFYHDGNSDKAFLQFLIDLSNTAQPASIYSISYTVYEVEVSTSQQISFDIEAMKLGARGVTLVVAAGDDGVTGYKYPNPPYTKCGYYASWPASSAYVTALGGTMNGYALTKTPEIALSSATGSRLTTGGGFSNRRSIPKFQRRAVADYLSKYQAPQSTVQAYNTSNRGYPDLSLAANRYGKVHLRLSYFIIDVADQLYS
jgi:tripeptidyl-peptidase I